jgi:hypothetical protein
MAKRKRLSGKQIANMRFAVEAELGLQKMKRAAQEHKEKQNEKADPLRGMPPLQDADHG